MEVIPTIKSDVKRKLKNGDTLTIAISRGSYIAVTSAMIEQLDESLNKIEGLDTDITNKLELDYNGFDTSGGHSSQLPNEIYKYQIKNLNSYTKYFIIAVKYNSLGTENEELVYSKPYAVDTSIK